MAAAVSNNVWVAPGQDAQFQHKPDGRRGEDHGQVFCNIPGSSSGFLDYNLVGDCICLLRLSLSITVSLMCADFCGGNVACG